MPTADRVNFTSAGNAGMGAGDRVNFTSGNAYNTGNLTSGGNYSGQGGYIAPSFTTTNNVIVEPPPSSDNFYEGVQFTSGGGAYETREIHAPASNVHEVRRVENVGLAQPPLVGATQERNYGAVQEVRHVEERPVQYHQ